MLGILKNKRGRLRDTPSGVSRSSIRLRRVILLRSYIRLAPSDIRYASLRRIE